MIYFTELQNLPMYGVKVSSWVSGRPVRRSWQQGARVASYLVRTPRRRFSVLTTRKSNPISVRAGQTNVEPGEIRCYAPDEGLIRIKKDVLDQQIIDVDNRKVVRVNDVDFDIEPINGHTENCALSPSMWDWRRRCGDCFREPWQSTAFA